MFNSVRKERQSNICLFNNCLNFTSIRYHYSSFFNFKKKLKQKNGDIHSNYEMVYAREREKKFEKKRETLWYAFVPKKWRELYCAHMADKEKSIRVTHTHNFVCQLHWRLFFPNDAFRARRSDAINPIVWPCLTTPDFRWWLTRMLNHNTFQL